MSFQKMYGLRGPSGLNMVNQAFIIVIAYRPRRRRRRKIPGIGRYPMGPTMKEIENEGSTRGNNRMVGRDVGVIGPFMD